MYDNDPVAIKEEVKLLMSSEQFTRVTAEYKVSTIVSLLYI